MPSLNSRAALRIILSLLIAPGLVSAWEPDSPLCLTIRFCNEWHADIHVTLTFRPSQVYILIHLLSFVTLSKDLWFLKIPTLNLGSLGAPCKCVAIIISQKFNNIGKYSELNTVEPLYNRQVGASAFCPLYGGVLYRKVLHVSIITFTSKIIFIAFNNLCRIYKWWNGKLTECIVCYGEQWRGSCQLYSHKSP